ncbi:MAG TPA: hypothetical protein VJQ50_08280 [Terriglobales bacterium]|nr:hypothetical protein [Terriglobales bacterium]
MKGRKRSHVVLIQAGVPPGSRSNPEVNHSVLSPASVEREEDVFLQKLLSLADIALDAWSKPKGKKLA